MSALNRDRLFVALTRPQMFAGVTYSYFILNGFLAAEFFLIFRSLWVVALALIIHVVGVVMCLRDPRAIDLWLTHSIRCPRVPNHKLWQCNSYRP